jgi:hypothetical protein
MGSPRMALLCFLVAVTLAGGLPRPPAVNDKVYHHLVNQFEEGFAMFQHFGVSTFAKGNAQGVGGSNDCWHGPNVRPDAVTAPCLDPKLFNPRNYSATQSVEVAKSFGASEICITAHHEGGFTLWPSNFSSYGVHASNWKNGNGDVLEEFASACRAAGIKICYYIGPNANGYLISHNVSATEFVERQLGQFTELLTNSKYGPVHRFWIDHPWQTCHNYSADAAGPPYNPRYTACPPKSDDASGTLLFPREQLKFDDLVSALSPNTIMGGSEYWNGPTKMVYPNYLCACSQTSHAACSVQRLAQKRKNSKDRLATSSLALNRPWPLSTSTYCSAVRCTAVPRD